MAMGWLMDNPATLSRSEASLCPARQTFRCAQGDTIILRNRQQPATSHIINEAANRDVLWNKRSVLDSRNIITHRLFQVFERQEIDMFSIGIQLLLQFLAQIFITEGEHATVGMVNDYNFISPE